MFLGVLIINNLVEKFKKYYYEYLGCGNKTSFLCAKNDNFKVNGFTYPIIISYYEDKVIYSVSNKYYEKIENFFKENKNINDVEKCLTVFFTKIDERVIVQRMQRMTKIKESDISIMDVVCISEEHKSIFFNSFIHNKDDKYKQFKWDNLLKNRYINGIIKDNKIVSLGFVSNIDCGGANIVIQTIEGYRNKGYGKMIVERISRDVLKDGILPIYWVNEQNTCSIKLAESLGFETQVLETVVKYE